MLHKCRLSALRGEVEQAMRLWSVQGCTVVVVQGHGGEILALGKPLSSRGLTIKTRIKTFFPRFTLYDKVAESEFSFEDILCHRTGLPGYDHLWNEGYHLSELPERLGHLKPTAGFREVHQYNSLLYDLAALLIEELTGKAYTQYTKEQFFDPLGMQSATFSHIDEGSGAQFEIASASANGFWKRVNVDGTEDENRMLSFGLGKMDGGIGTGRLWMDGEDAAKWLKALPAIPEYAEAVEPRTIAGSAGGLEFADHEVLYGLGQRISTHRGVRINEHSGEVPGFLTRFSRLPDHDAGFAILTNSDPGGKYLRAFVKCRLVEAFAGLPKLDWLGRIEEARQAVDTATRQWLATPVLSASAPATSLLELGLRVDNPLIGRWESEGFDTWTIRSTDLVATLPVLGSLPFIASLYGEVRYLFCPVRDYDACGPEPEALSSDGGKAGEVRRYRACLEWKSHDFGEEGPMYGYPFDVVLRDEGRKMEVIGFTGVGEALREEDWGVVFDRAVQGQAT